ncbi:ABC transporter permease [Actinocrispum sp. NPDC049592]|uniref:ABC transporter permease n=1 Tax=Actinocrispum sp. NPDC049592 TaxID=3154835 RepID=UPI00343CDE55
MSTFATTARIGVRRGLIELKQSLRSYTDLAGMLFPSAILLVVMLFMRGSTIGTTGFSLGAATLPSSIGMSVAFGGLMALAQSMAVEREDGTLLRAKATPNGMQAYLISKVFSVSVGSVIGLLLLLVPGAFLFDGLALGSVGSWLLLALVLLIGLVATMPLGAVIGAMFKNPRYANLMTLPMMGMVGISGIFFPLSEAARWLQDLAQVFPIYWLGLGMRHALLPDSLKVVEIGGSWRPVEMVLVLTAWAVAGLILAPVVLRRMARRESGSNMERLREKAMKRVT